MESLQPLAAAADPVAGPRPALPRETPLSAEEVRALRRFHLGAAAGGDSGEEGSEPRPVEPGMIAAALWPYRDPEALSTGFPLFLGPPATGEAALCLPAAELLARAARGAGIAGGPLAAELPRLERALAAAVAAARDGTGDARSTVAAAGAAVVATPATGGAGRGQLEADLGRLVDAIPAGGGWAALDVTLPLRLARLAALDRLLPAWGAFGAEAASLAERLAPLLAGGEAVDDLGGLGARFIDRGALTGLLARQRGRDLEPERRRRLERARAALAGFAAGAPPEPLLETPLGAAPSAPAALEGWRHAEADDVCAAAAERFDREAAALAEVLRAARLARLELAGDYDPALHGPWLERFDWQAFSRDELMLLPAVVAWLPADLAACAGMVALSRLLLSGRPVQVVVPVAPALNPGAPVDSGGDPAERLAGYRFEPAYLGIAHREALVQQTAAARPLHAMEGFRRAARAACAALHVVAVPAEDAGAGGPGPHLLAAAALEGRAHPLFHYDPEAGPTWARRFDFAGNPAPAADWPRYELAAAAEEGGETALETAFTFADYALLDPAFAPCFRALPPGAAAGELAPLADWLGFEAEDAPARIPFVWAIDGDGRLRRLAVSRALALACRDRLDFWRALQELSGARSEYAREAADRTREEVAESTRAERERLEARHAGELACAEREAAERLATRLTEMLLAPETGAIETAAGQAPTVLSGLAGGDAEQVAAVLLALVGPALETDGDGAAAPADPRVERTARQLLAALGDPAELQ
jgi:hypothetical protein